MSTYQGERFVVEQIRSILDQLPEKGVILVRDDGSVDATVAKIEALNDSRITIIKGSNIGFARSFLSLVMSAPADSDVVMLADQDDVWLPGKIERAIDYLLSRGEEPALYCSRLRLVDVNLNPLGLSPKLPQKLTFQNALAESVVVGCTAAFNRPALQLIRQVGDISKIHFHDWWVSLVVAAFGEVYGDSEPTVLYRQHGGNVIGMGAGMDRYWKIIHFIRKSDWIHIMFNQIENFRKVFGNDLSPENRNLFETHFNPHAPMSIFRLVSSRRRFRRTFIDDVLLRLMIILSIVRGRGLLPGNECDPSNKMM